jgi:LacI family transcriptional regulator, gluconate utilization system Gnt-I transcriptional repressor
VGRKIHSPAGQGAAARPTMRDVSALAGVSVMTVSRALSTPHTVSPANLAKVQNAVSRIGYVPDHIAGALSSQRSRIVSLLLPTLANQNFADLAEGMTDVLLPAGYQPLIGYAGHSLDKEEQLVRTMLARRPDAFVLMGTTHSRETARMLQTSGAIVIQTWEYTQDPLDLCVGFSNFQIGEMAARHLAQLGHHTLAAIGGSMQGDLQDRRGEQRLRGFCHAAEQLGLGTPHVIRDAPVPIRHGHGAGCMAQLLERAPGVDAVFAISDTLAFGAIMECHRRGIAVPDQISILGFGDFDIGAQSLPALSTISIFPRRIGALIGDHILARLNGETPRTQLTEAKLIIRQSTRAAPSR